MQIETTAKIILGVLAGAVLGWVLARPPGDISKVPLLDALTAFGTVGAVLVALTLARRDSAWRQDHESRSRALVEPIIEFEAKDFLWGCPVMLNRQMFEGNDDAFFSTAGFEVIALELAQKADIPFMPKSYERFGELVSIGPERARALGYAFAVVEKFRVAMRNAVLPMDAIDNPTRKDQFLRALDVLDEIIKNLSIATALDLRDPAWSDDHRGLQYFIRTDRKRDAWDRHFANVMAQTRPDEGAIQGGLGKLE